MIYDLQKASMWKRISAFLCDIILFCIVAVGIAFLFSTALGVDAHQDKMIEICNHYVGEYDLDAFLTEEELSGELYFTITEERYNALSEADRATYDAATGALLENEDYLYAYGMVNQLILLVLTFSILIAHLILEFAVPLLFKNGMTVGKKIFGVGVMRVDAVKISPLILLVRTLLGKYAVETMIPVFVLISLMLGTADIVTLILLFLLIVAQLGFLIFTKGNTPIHDLLAGTVTVDFASQMIFDSPEELLEYKKRLHSESVEQKSQHL